MALVNQGSVSGGANFSSTGTLTLPSHVADDVFLLFHGGANTPTSFATGYTQFTGSVVSAGSARSAAGYRKATSSSETNPTITWSGTQIEAMCLIQIRGADPTTPILAQNHSENGFSNSITPPSLDASGATVFSVIAVGNENTPGGSFVWPSGWTLVTENLNGGFGDACGIAINTAPGTGAIAPGAVTITNTRGIIAWHILVQAPTGVGGTKARQPFRRSAMRFVRGR